MKDKLPISSQFSKNLIVWFKIHQRKLPWRETKNPYLIWVSEVMLQQTQVKKVLEYYQKFIDQFPDVYTLAQAELLEILKAWEGLGYYARARNLHKAAKIVVEEMKGVIPSKYSDLRKLPGVGDYIAAAVVSQAFNAPYPVVDGNVKRVLSRLFLVDSPINTSSATKIFQERANMLLDHRQPGFFNQAMMELGAIICRPQNPACAGCPVSLFCRAYKTHQQQQFPVTTKTKRIPEHHISVGIVYKNNCILIVQRNTTGLLGGLWEFPGGRVNNGESIEGTCIKRIKEKVNISIEICEHLTRIKHAYTHFKIMVDVFRCKYKSGNAVLNGHIAYRWIKIDEIEQFPFHAMNHKFIPLLKQKSNNISSI